MKFKLKVWRQEGPHKKGRMVVYLVDNVSEHASFLEMLDVLNEKLIAKGEEPVAFDHDCREGICGSCGLMIDGQAHGPERSTTVCQLHMRKFKNNATIYIEPWRGKSFPIIKDLVVDRSALDRIIQAGGFISINTGSAPDANQIPIGKEVSDQAMDAAQCIGCGACVASCKNSSAMLFTAAKISHLSLLPQGQVEKKKRVLDMVARMDQEGFGSCSSQLECEAACPKDISTSFISRMNREYFSSIFS